MGYAVSRSVGQIIEKPCGHSRGHSFGSNFINLAQNDHLDEMQSSEDSAEDTVDAGSAFQSLIVSGKKLCL